ncbi:hypothetical protein, partial [Streptococcus minor]|uniref:hypothetical protein n=1 Tax=Streptococcus minor TaxID=229549 RepID=UPI001C89ABB3
MMESLKILSLALVYRRFRSAVTLIIIYHIMKNVTLVYETVSIMGFFRKQAFFLTKMSCLSSSYLLILDATVKGEVMRFEEIYQRVQGIV